MPRSLDIHLATKAKRICTTLYLTQYVYIAFLTIEHVFLVKYCKYIMMFYTLRHHDRHKLDAPDTTQNHSLANFC